MITIYKYSLETTDYQEVEMPKGAIIRAIQIQGDWICLWAEVNTANPKEIRRIEMFGTGHPIRHDFENIDRNYLATVQDTSLVWHFYERF